MKKDFQSSKNNTVKLITKTKLEKILLQHTKVIRHIPVLASHILIDLSRDADTKYGPGLPPLFAPFNRENQTNKIRYISVSTEGHALNTSVFYSNLPSTNCRAWLLQIFPMLGQYRIPNECNLTPDRAQHPLLSTQFKAQLNPAITNSDRKWKTV